MCGLVGTVLTESNDTNFVRRRLKRISHRGPDGRDLTLLKLCNKVIRLGHVRLALNDLSDHSSQPMSFEHLTIVFNGEIYNFKSLRRELQLNGYIFESEGDTEVLLKSWHAWGVECLERLNGMFAFCLVDTKHNRLTLVRDRFGVKPIYYRYSNVSFEFGSELKSLIDDKISETDVNLSAVVSFLKYGYLNDNICMVRNVNKVLPGEIIDVDLASMKITKNLYWSAYVYGNQKTRGGGDRDFEDLVDEADSLVDNACKLRLFADRDVGLFLSGGYDSSLIAAKSVQHNSKVKTFNVGFEYSHLDESNDAANTARFLGTDHTSIMCTTNNVLELYEQLPLVWDEPLGDTSCIPMLLLSKITSQEVTASLSADGADELFTGYNKYTRINKLNSLRNNNLISRFSNILRNGIDNISFDIKWYENFSRRASVVLRTVSAPSLKDAFFDYQQIFSETEIKALITNESHDQIFEHSRIELQEDDCFDYLRVLDIESYLSGNILAKVDRSTMFFGLEGRDPFLDLHLAEFALGVSSDQRVYKGTPKAIIRALANKSFPKGFLDRPKKGFTSPVGGWLKGVLKDKFVDLLDLNCSTRNSFFKSSYLKQVKNNLISEHFNERKLWHLFVLLLWFEYWVDSKK